MGRVGLVALFLCVHLAFPLVGSAAFRRFATASFLANLAARTDDPWILHRFGGLLWGDGGHYLGIAIDGYATPASWAFFPLYPYAARALGPLFGGVPQSGLVLSFLASAVCCVALHAMTAGSHGEEAAARAVALFLAFPTHFFFEAFYTEAVFFAFTTLALLFGSRERWAIAAVFGALAAATRSSGILLFPALVFGSLHRAGWRRVDPRLAWLVLIPAATGAFLLFAYLKTGSADAPLLAQHFWARKATFPLLTILQAAQDLRLDPWNMQRDLDCLATLAGFAIAARSLRQSRAGESAYFLLALLMPLSSGLVHSMFRYIGGIPPLYSVLARDLGRRWPYAALVAGSAALELVLLVAFSMGRGLV
jgi:hypothetical protein